MPPPDPIQQLASFRLPEAFRSQRPWLRWLLWMSSGELLLASPLPGSAWRRGLLRAFGAHVGRQVVLKPRLRVKFPWRLEIGDHAWIGEAVWIDNPDWVWIGRDVCLSQGVYLCTGNHDYRSPCFAYRLAPIRIEPEVWVCAMARIAPGTRIHRGAVVAFASVVHGELAAMTIHRGNPAVAVAPRL